MLSWYNTKLKRHVYQLEGRRITNQILGVKGLILSLFLHEENKNCWLIDIKGSKDKITLRPLYNVSTWKGCVTL